MIGSRNSSNSVRLVEVAKNNGCENAELIHSESTFPLEKISKCKTIGISSGASAPEVLVNEFIENIKKKFTVEIEEVEIVKEDVTFKITRKIKLMAVYTRINQSDLSLIEKNFNIGKIVSFSGIKKGIENTNYLIKTNKKK